MPADLPDKPSLRPIDAMPVVHDGRSMVVLTDASGFSETSLVVSEGALLLMELMDGTNDLRDIQAAFFRRTKQLIDSEQIAGLVRALDDALLLDSPRFAAAHATVEEAYRAAELRPAAFAGRSYPDEPDELRAGLDAFYLDPAGPGALPAPLVGSPGDVRAVVAPHIDFARGGAAYAHAYAALAAGSSARLFVVLGTAHAGCDGLFGLTRKGYDTPLGAVPCDVDLVEDVVRRCDGEEWFSGELAHRTEHSVEFQAVWLRHLFPEADDLRIVPVLCGSFQPWVAGGGLPGDDPRVAAFVDALRGALADRGEPAVVVAGADLAHVGPRFGDPAPPSEASLERLAEQDGASLDHVCRGDADAFFRDVAADGDSRRICGLASIYLALRVVGPVRGEVLQYGQAEDPAGPSAVSFAALVLREQPG